MGMNMISIFSAREQHLLTQEQTVDCNCFAVFTQFIIFSIRTEHHQHWLEYLHKAVTQM